MFTCSHPSLVLDQFRVPYEVVPAQRPDGYATLRAARTLRWPVFGDGGAPRRFRLGPLVLHGRVLPADAVPAGWHPEEPQDDVSVWRNDDGDILLPFDPDEVVTTFWREDYVARSNNGRSTALAGYYLLRPLIPRPVQIWARRRYSRVPARTP